MSDEKTAGMAERLREVAGNDSLGEVARKLALEGADVTPQAVHLWFRGGEVREENLAAFARAYGVREAWLRYGDGERADASAVARSGGEMLEALPGEMLQQTIDFIGYQLSKPNVQVAEETRASYRRFIERVLEDRERKHQGR
jgi:LmbE family N-acetylglucosaminyl deacetylase